MILSQLILADYLKSIRDYDLATFSHCIRVNLLAMRIGEIMQLSEEEMNNLFVASALHDYGKIFIPKQLLLQDKRFTLEERKVVQLHVDLGYQNLMKSALFSSEALRAIHEHHQRLDGSGYPDCTLEISTLGRILGVVDVYDAMTNKRCYKDRYSTGYTLQTLRKGSNTLYDEEVIKALSTAIESGFSTDNFNSDAELQHSFWFSD